jgi:hypothetical protein
MISARMKERSNVSRLESKERIKLVMTACYFHPADFAKKPGGYRPGGKDLGGG